MICDQLQSLLGFDCHPLNEAGSVAVISTPFTFDDGDGVPVFVETVPGHVRFFDDGEVLMHLLGRGLGLDGPRKTRFLKTIAAAHGAILNDFGEVEVWGTPGQASTAFAKYMATMLEIVGWEREQRGTSTDATLLVEEVAMYLRAWKKDSVISETPEYMGISGHTYRLDFQVDDQGVVAISPHPLSVSTAIKKLLDIVSAPVNEGVRLQVVLDDRKQPDEAKSEAAVLNAVADVLMMSRLEALAGAVVSTN